MKSVNTINLDGEDYGLEDAQARQDANAAMRAAADAVGKVDKIIAGDIEPGSGTGGGEEGGEGNPKPAGKLYGARWYKTQSLTKLERTLTAEGMTFSPSVGASIGRSDFDGVYPWSDCRLCNYANGAVTYYEDEAGFSRSPASGDVMLEIPKFYYKIDENSLYRETIISSQRPGDGPAPEGFHISPRHAPTAGNPSGWDKIYASAYTLNSSYRSISGNNSIVSIDRPTARAGCRNRGNGYQLMDYAALGTISLLYLVETADLNSQTAIGPGFTDATNTAQIATGGANGVAWHSGRASGNAAAAKNAIKYRHLENLWGNLWQWIDGINFNNSLIYVNTNPATYADDVAGSYTQLSYTKAAANGYIKALGFDPALPWAQICTDATGADGTFVSDHYWQNTAWRALLFGGSWSNAGNAGLFCFSSHDAASRVGTTLGCRLLVLP